MIPPLLRACRPQQWVKNGLIAVPMLAGHHVHEPARWALAGLAVVAFSAAASAVYLINDLRDVEADRAHPTKRHRPLAAGTLAPRVAAAAAGLLLTLGLGVGLLVDLGPLAAGVPLRTGVEVGLQSATDPAVLAAQAPLPFTVLLALYAAAALAYAMRLKGVVLVDVGLLAGFYLLRVLAGGAATLVVPSPWLLAFAGFLFLSLALAKRHAELAMMSARGDADHAVARGRGYRVDDMPLVSQLGTTTAGLAVLVTALYLNTDAVVAQYTRPRLLWLAPPVLFLWTARLWLKAHRRTLHQDPLVFALTDRPTRLMTLALLAIALAAR